VVFFSFAVLILKGLDALSTETSVSTSLAMHVCPSVPPHTFNCVHSVIPKGEGVWYSCRKPLWATATRLDMRQLWPVMICVSRYFCLQSQYSLNVFFSQLCNCYLPTPCLQGMPGYESSYIVTILVDEMPPPSFCLSPKHAQTSL